MRKTIFTLGSAAVAALMMVSPASAKVSSLDCSAVTFSVTTVDCLGFFGTPPNQNLITESGPKFAIAVGYTATLDPAATSLLEKIDTGNDPTKLFGNTIDFDTVLSGLTVIGIHFGGGSTGFNGTGFWLLDIPDNTDTITWSSSVQSGISNAGLYLTGGAVPEPATWAMMIAGFGLTGAAMRRRKTRVAVTYA